MKNEIIFKGMKAVLVFTGIMTSLLTSIIFSVDLLTSRFNVFFVLMIIQWTFTLITLTISIFKNRTKSTKTSQE